MHPSLCLVAFPRLLDIVHADQKLYLVFEFLDVEAAAPAVKSFVKAGDVVLLKASRATRLERIVELLRPADAGRKN